MGVAWGRLRRLWGAAHNPLASCPEGVLVPCGHSLSDRNNALGLRDTRNGGRGNNALGL